MCVVSRVGLYSMIVSFPGQIHKLLISMGPELATYFRVCCIKSWSVFYGCFISWSSSLGVDFYGSRFGYILSCVLYHELVCIL